ncbi:MAG: CpaD family pilus assembly protein [Hyphomicrobiaceae bacterium]
MTGIAKFAGRPRLSAAVTVLAAFAIAGCREHTRLDAPTAAVLNDPAKRHPIAFSARTEALYVEVPSDRRGGLSSNQEGDIIRFLGRYKVEAQGPLAVSAPGTPRGHMAASRSVREIQDLIDRAGIPPEALRQERARGRDPGGPSVKLSYQRAVALAPVCGSWPEDAGSVGRERLPLENFGCASQRNLAMTVANARDLQVPQEETPAASEKRTASWSKYTGAGAPSSGGGGAASSSGAASAPAKK